MRFILGVGSLSHHQGVIYELFADSRGCDEVAIPWQRPARRPYPVSRPVLSERAKAYLAEVLASGWWGYGPVARQLERVCAELLGERFGVLATSSCTGALHLALLAEGIGPGDEVILPAFTYVSTAAVIRYTGATPIFADIDPTTKMIDVKSANRRLSARTRAVIAVHYAGQPGPFGPLSQWAKASGLVMIEDCAHALGSLDENGQPVGASADYAAFSFAATKPLPSCGGGILTYADKSKADKIASLSMLGLTTDTFTRFHDSQKLPAQIVGELGYHYRINDVAAALALAQLEDLPMIRAQRMKLIRRYLALLDGVDGLTLPVWSGETQPCWYLMTVQVDPAKRDPLRRWLADRRIDTSVHYPNLASGPVFLDGHAKLPVTKAVAETVLSLPLFGDMTLADVDHVAAKLKEGLASIEA